MQNLDILYFTFFFLMEKPGRSDQRSGFPFLTYGSQPHSSNAANESIRDLQWQGRVCVRTLFLFYGKSS